MYLAIDVETTYEKGVSQLPWNRKARLSTVAVFTSEGEEKIWVFHHDEINQTQTEKEALESLQDYINRAHTLIGQNIKFDYHWLTELGLNLDGKRLFCTMVAEYILSAQTKKMPSLDYLAEKYLGERKLDVVKLEYWECGINTAQVPLEILSEYNIDDCRLTLRIAQAQIQSIHNEGMGKLIDLKMKEIPVLAEIERHGLRLDDNIRVELENVYTNRLAAITSRLEEIHGRKDLDLSSPEKLSVFLYGGTYKKLGRLFTVRTLKDGTAKLKSKGHQFPVRFRGVGFKPIPGSEAKKAGFYSTSTDILPQLRVQAKTEVQKEVITLLLERSAIAQLLKTYIVGFATKHWDGIVHCEVNQAITATGRFSSSSPNLQNVAVRGEGTIIRSMFFPQLEVFVEGDLSQLEWVAAAFLSQCPVMLKDIYDGVDQHALVRKTMFNDKVDRTTAKIFNFRMIYGGSPYSFFADPKMPAFSLQKWTKIVKAFYKKYYGLAKWQQENFKEVNRSGGWLTNPTGRKFKFTKQLGKYGHEYRKPQIANYPVQSFATADLVPLAMIEIRNRLLHLQPEAFMCNQVHDSIMYDCRAEHVEEIARTMLEVFRDLPRLVEDWFGIKMNVPMDGEVKVGPTWKEMTDYTLEEAT